MENKCACVTNLITQRDGNQVCKECGSVFNEMCLSEIPEWDITNTYSIDDIENPYTTLSTFTQKGSKSLITVNGKIYNNDIYKLHIQNSYNNKQRAFDKMETFLENHTNNYPKCIITTTKQLWHHIMETKKITRGQIRIGILACCLYYSCIFHSTSRTHKEISNEFNITNKTFNKSHKIFEEMFKYNKEWSFLLYQNISVENYLLRFCSDICLYEKDSNYKNYYELYNKCIEYYDTKKSIFKENFITNPKNISCAILYNVINENQNYNSTFNKKYFVNNMDISYPTLNKLLGFL